MPEDLNFENYVTVNRFFLTVTGVWPLPNEAPVWRIRLQNLHTSIVFAALLLFILTPMALDIYMYLGNIEAVVQNLCVSLHTLVVFMKFTYLIGNKSTFKDIVEGMKKNWRDTLLSPSVPNDKRKILLYNARIARTLTKLFFFSVYCLNSLICLFPIIYGINSDPVRKRRYPACAWYYYDQDSTAAYIFFYLSQIFLIEGLGVSFIIGMDSFFCVAIAHCCAQLSILQKELVELGNDSNVSLERVKELIRKHNDQIRTVRQLDKIFGKLSLFQLLLGCISICVTGFQIIICLSKEVIDFNGLLYYAVFFWADLFQILLYCWPGNELMVQSMEVGNAAYQSSWTNLSHSSSQAVLFLILMAQKPLNITAGGIYVMSLENFTKIVKAAMSLLSGLRAFYANS